MSDATLQPEPHGPIRPDSPFHQRPQTDCKYTSFLETPLQLLTGGELRVVSLETETNLEVMAGVREDDGDGH